MNELYPIIRRQRRPLSGAPIAKPVVPVEVCPHCGRSLTSVTLESEPDGPSTAENLPPVVETPVAKSAPKSPK